MVVPPTFLALFWTAGLLTAASAETSPIQTYPFQRMVSANSVATGVLSVRSGSTLQSESILTLSGLVPNRAYVAHYHALGPAGSDSCISEGPIALGFPAFTADAQGNARVTLRAGPTGIQGNAGAYVNVHLASDLSDVPLCAAVAKGITTPTTSKPVIGPATQRTVTIGDNTFEPRNLTVPVGTTVSWSHTGQVTHNIFSLQVAELQSQDLRPGDTFSYTFKTPGTYTYYCSYHDGMSAMITVTNR
ncbi:cupredoxin domain-containing protein [Deinococcus hopiensis]|uniref:Plastocyanin n=1 Tax=Deinococcus hopiensis KR-140 TaxID=695939 RepID=A0A1W1UTN1_9DEIO|nr:plastocyanin/azurin family copper-binding protein [Deinococcus hopiensis]SMB84462.1 Plastocyanin [Deinococcus hopiensis KR-140]